MCGRYNIIPDARAFVDAYQIIFEILNGEPRYNISPGTEQVVMRVGRNGRTAQFMHWGLVPYWAKDRAIGAKLSNARSDTISVKPAFRSAFRERRCLIPASGYYEWKSAAGKKYPYLFRMRNEEPFAMAGIWEHWEGPPGVIHSFAVITTEPNALAATIHDRMPVIIPKERHEEWLNPDLQDPARIQPMLASYPAEAMTVRAVSPKLNSARNQGPEVIDPA
ncbi:MAG TPA: SOS response-associated peptidase [Burkholderiales bacterium]|nr:SOS response-associated peptidase [Burkholderiales bacterium]